MSGVLFFLLLLAAILVMPNPPGVSSSGTKIVSFYRSHKDQAELSSWFTILAVFVGVGFYGLLRDHLRRGGGTRGLAASGFGGAIIFAASGCLSAGMFFALGDAADHLSPAAAQALNTAERDGTSAFEFAGVAVMMAGFGLAIVRSGLLPRWLGWVGLAIALVALVQPIGFIGFIAAGFWTVICGIVLTRRRFAGTAVAEVDVVLTT
ncbi:MAG TPA: DUF4386 family protein [Gaiellaceae bacterium]